MCKLGWAWFKTGIMRQYPPEYIVGLNGVFANLSEFFIGTGKDQSR